MHGFLVTEPRLARRIEYTWRAANIAGRRPIGIYTPDSSIAASGVRVHALEKVRGWFTRLEAAANLLAWAVITSCAVGGLGGCDTGECQGEKRCQLHIGGFRWWVVAWLLRKVIEIAWFWVHPKWSTPNIYTLWTSSTARSNSLKCMSDQSYLIEL